MTTVQICSKLEKFDIKVIRHENNKGYGAALKTGIKNASGDIIITIDADNTYFPRDIQRLVQFGDRYDMVVGARVIDAGRHFSFHQKLAKGFICLLLRMIFKQEILDVNSGLRLMRKSVVEKYLPILPDSFSFTASITLAMLLDNHKIKYVPIGYSKRIGKSKVKIFSYTLNFIKSYWRIMRKRL